MGQKTKRSIVSLGKEIFKLKPKRKKQRSPDSSDNIEFTSRSTSVLPTRTAIAVGEREINFSGVLPSSPRQPNDGLELDPSPQTPNVGNDESQESQDASPMNRKPEMRAEAEQEGSFPQMTVLTKYIDEAKERAIALLEDGLRNLKINDNIN
jgi:hypothetical protein